MTSPGVCVCNHPFAVVCPAGKGVRSRHEQPLPQSGVVNVPSLSCTHWGGVPEHLYIWVGVGAGGVGVGVGAGVGVGVGMQVGSDVHVASDLNFPVSLCEHVPECLFLQVQPQHCDGHFFFGQSKQLPLVQPPAGCSGHVLTSPHAHPLQASWHCDEVSWQLGQLFAFPCPAQEKNGVPPHNQPWHEAWHSARVDAPCCTCLHV